MKVLTGIAASPGVTLGPVFRVKERKRRLERTVIAVHQTGAEKERFDQAAAEAARQITAIMEKLISEGMENEAGIIEGQLVLLDDPQLAGDVWAKIDEESIAAEWAVSEAFGAYAAMFEQMDDDYLRERVTDLNDVKDRIIGLLLKESVFPFEGLTGPSIVIAHDLTPSVTSQMDRRLVLGVATEIGSRTSHSSILARTMGIPAVVGCAGLLHTVATDEIIMLDGDEGTIVVDPDEETRIRYEEKRAEMAKASEADDALRKVDAATADGVRIELAANIGRPADVPFVLEHGGDGVGLFRSEFLFMDRSSMPGEEEQFAAYRETAEALGGKPVIVRTLDIGGDKSLDYLNIPSEMNPFLGWRAVRYCLAEPELFRTQVRAILRAGAYGPVSMMFPMISGLNELLMVKEQVSIAMQELEDRGVSYCRNVPVGIMIEVPSAALTADRLAPHVDFFSIGTNDLIQYTLAVDRMNEKVSYLYDPSHIAVLRLIRMVCEVAERSGKWVGMCGEMAGDPAFTEILVGLGVSELSMSPSQIPKVKRALLQVQKAAAKNRALETIR
jgi:phosphotransferase system enzyme I (PtsI)